MGAGRGRHAARRSRAPLAAGALGLAVLAVGAAAFPDEEAPPAVRASQAPAVLPAFEAAPPVRIEPRPAVAAGPPERLLVPRLDVDVPVVGIDARRGVLRPPDDPQVLGWWRSGAVPGAARGSALVTGHTVSSGGGAFDRLETLRPGDAVRVRTANGLLRYEVAGVRVFRKARLARSAAAVFSQDVPGRLVLITCEDWDGTSYRSNVVVTAHRRP